MEMGKVRVVDTMSPGTPHTRATTAEATVRLAAETFVEQFRGNPGDAYRVLSLLECAMVTTDTPDKAIDAIADIVRKMVENG